MKMVKSLLLGSAAGFVAVAGAQAADLPVKAKPVEYVKVCTLYGAGFYYVPGTDTCLKLGAILRFQIESDATGGLPFMNGATGLYTRTDTPNLNHRVRANLTWDSRTQTEYGTLRMYFRGGWEQTTPGAPDDTHHWDRGFIQFAGFTVGRTGSFFDFFSLAPYSYANNGRISHDMGATGQMVFGYTAQLGNGFSASIAIEDGGNAAAGPNGNNSRGRAHSSLDLDAPVAGGIGNNTISFANATSTLTVDNGSSFTPDLVANIRVDQAWGSAQLSGALHVNSAGYYSGFVPGACIPGNSTTCDNPEEELGFAVSAGLLLNLPMLAPGDTIGFEAAYTEGALGYATRSGNVFRLWTHGDAAGGTLRSYGVGFGADSVFRNPGAIAGYDGSLQLTTAWSLNAGFQHFWTRQLRTSVYGGVVFVEYDTTAKNLMCAGSVPGVLFIPFGTSGLAVTNCDPDYHMWQIGSRTQWNPHPYLDIGVDVLWSHLDSAFQGFGVTTTPQGARPAGPVQIENQDVLTVMGRVQYNFIP
jgi:hypothetical protein